MVGFAVSSWFHTLVNLLSIADTTIGNSTVMEDEDDDDFDPNEKKKGKAKAVKNPAPATEALRKEQHTLDEHHEHLFSASFDLSFNTNISGQGPSSSQVDAPFDNFFPFSDGLEVGDDLGDDLARELGWNISPQKSVRSNRLSFCWPPSCISRIKLIYAGLRLMIHRR